MKTLTILVVALSSLVLLSFVQPSKGIKKIGDNLWEISSDAKLSREDRTNLENLIKKEYNLKDFRTTVSLDFKGDVRKAWVLVNNHVGPNFVDKKILAGDWKNKIGDKAMAGSEVEIKKILMKYGGTTDDK